MKTEEMFQRAAADFFEAAAAALARHGVCLAAISGGTTPDGWFAALATAGWPYWERVEWFWVDERAVPPENPDSNFGRARRLLAEPLHLAPERLHRMEAEKADGAERYRTLLAEDQRLFDTGSRFPRFDYLQLGIGLDGHTASLFPFSPALEESRETVVAVPPPRTALPAVPRLTLTLPVINAARRIAVLATGTEKTTMLQRRLHAPAGADAPISLVRPVDGELTFFLSV